METINVQQSLERIGRCVGGMPAGVNRAGAITALTILIAAAATFAWRWLAGALVDPLEPALLLTAGTFTVGLAAVARIGWPRSAPSRLDWIATTIASLAAAIMLAALCLPGAPPACVAAIGLLLATEETWVWGGRFRSLRNSRRLTASGEKHPDSSTFRGLLAPGYCKQSLAAFDAMPAEEVTQQLIRSRAADGTEAISGWLRAFFAPGQRTGSVHVAICPPLDFVPEVAVEQIEGPEARIKTAQVLPYGVRLDLKLAAAATEPIGVLLQFSAASAREKQPVCR